MPFQPESPELRAYVQLIADSNEGFEKVQHSTYDETVSHMLDMAVHCVQDRKAENPKIQELIHKRRPNEDEGVYDHRIANFRQNTLAHYKKIKNTLEKVFSEKLTAIDFPDMPRSITSTLEAYLMNLPIGKAGKTMTMREYTRGIAFECMLRDANGAIAILPKLESIDNPTQFKEPIPVHYPSDQVIDVGRDYFLLLTTMTSPFNEDGQVFFLIDSEYIHIIFELERVNGKRRFETEVYFRHDLGEVPVVPMMGDDEKVDKEPMKYSYISGILPNFDEALVLKSDYQAVKVRISYPIPWSLKTRCRRCNGKGQLPSGAMGGKLTNCTQCKGTGNQVAWGPADRITIDPKDMAEGKIPNPPGGYIQPQSFMEELKKDIDAEIQEGMASISMDTNRKDTNIEESGKAKEVGRIDLNTFMEVIANAIYTIEEQMIQFIAAMRYGPAGINPEEIVPTIERPTEFDLLTTGDHINRVGDAKSKNVSPTITGKMELDLLQKEYGEDSDIYQMKKAIHGLDPLPDLLPEQAINIEAHTKEIDLWIHFNIERLIRQAVALDPNFYRLEYTPQWEIISGMAEEELKEKEVSLPPVQPVPPPPSA